MKYGTILRRAECLVDYWPKGENHDAWVAKCYRLNFGKSIKAETVKRARELCFNNSGPIVATFDIPAHVFKE